MSPSGEKGSAKVQIKNWWSAAVLWEGEAADLRDAVLQAVAADANLRDADLTGANLRDAKSVRLPTGELLDEYFNQTLPALLTAAGKSLDSFKPHWECHSWDNCPMAHAFDAHDLSGVPLLLRPRAQQFVKLFDARQIPWERVQAAIDAAKSEAQ